MKDLSLEEKIEIAFNVTIEKQHFKDIAAIHNIKVALVQSIASKVHQNKSFLKELRNKQNKKDQRKDAIIEATVSAIEQGAMIESTDQIKKQVDLELESPVPRTLVRDVFR